MNIIVTSVDTIDVDELIKDFKVENVEQFGLYLQEVYRDLSLRSEDKYKGITKITFLKYYDLPGIISERLFAVFDKSKNEYIDFNEFKEGMMTLFIESYEKMLKFIFNLYDFDKDSYISREDIRVVLSYIPLNTQKKVDKDTLKYEKEEFKDRVESQDELFILLEKCFMNVERMDFSKFKETVEKVSSDIFLYILIFLMEKRPFSKKTLNEFQVPKNKKPATNSNTALLKVNGNPSNNLIASPNLSSKFSPSVTIGKSPTMNKRALDIKSESSNILNKYSKNPATTSQKPVEKEIEKEKIEESKSNIQLKQPVKKTRMNLKEIEDNTTTKRLDKNVIEEHQINEVDNDNNNFEFGGFLYKFTNLKNLKKLWFKLVGKDLYYFKTKEDKVHKGMHNMSGVFLKEEGETIINEKKLYSFSVLYTKKTRIYYAESQEDYKNWINAIRKVTGYCSLSENYEVKQDLGKGKFGLVKLGIHNQTKRKAAIKIMNKREMKNKDLELVKVEIEILKIGQHPNIVRLYDVIETSDNIYIIMEYCSGGDLFSYLEKRGFKLNEPRAAQLIHKLSTAIFYLHSYGIAHRDLKPENILMTDDTENADIRLLDFGLSKIIGPNETCHEPFGTLSYVAPEVLLEKPYNKSVDLWSIGIITYLMLCGSLPFDDEFSDREIARQTIHDPVPFYPYIWKKLSSEAKEFVENLLQKEASKRMSIKECCDHGWIQKFHQSNIVDIRKANKDSKVSSFKMYSTTEEKN